MSIKNILSDGDGKISHRDLASLACILGIWTFIVAECINLFYDIADFKSMSESLLIIFLTYVAGNKIAKDAIPHARDKYRYDEPCYDNDYRRDDRREEDCHNNEDRYPDER